LSGTELSPEQAAELLNAKAFETVVNGDVLDIDILPNRPDCLSVVGIAREVAALTGQQVHIPEITYEENGGDISDKVSIEITDADLCPGYCATLITGVTIGESPAWLQERLSHAGQRPINNIVDISNYIMLEYGQPLHTFDYDRLAGQKITVRRAEPAENFTTLPRTVTGLSLRSILFATISATVLASGPCAFGTFAISGDCERPWCTRLASREAGTAPVAVPASVPKTILSNFLLSDLLSKLLISVAFSIVASAPCLTGALLTAAHISPSRVLSRR